MTEVNVQFTAARRAVALGHVLFDDVERLRTGDQDGAEVANERLDDVALFEIERVRGGDRFAFLPKRSIKTADHLRLTKQRDEALFQCARQSEVVIDFEKLFAGEGVFRHVRRASYHRITSCSTRSMSSSERSASRSSIGCLWWWLSWRSFSGSGGRPPSAVRTAEGRCPPQPPARSSSSPRSHFPSARRCCTECHFRN